MICYSEQVQFGLIFCFIFLLFWVTPAKAEIANPVILDTDLSSDVDDAGAVAVLHGLADQKKVQILGMMTSSGDPWSGPCLDAFNTHFGRPDIPIGVIKREAVTHVSKYTRHIAENYPHDFPIASKAPDAVDLYRKLLASQPADSVTLVSVGYLSNLSALLQSGADKHSSLSGKDLVLEKVKRLICMGGNFPSGREWNFYQDTESTAYVVSQWPTPIIFCGFEIGSRIMTGQILRNVTSNYPLKEAYRLYNKLTNRQSWDQTTVLLASVSDPASFPYLKISAQGQVRVDPSGNNSWEPVKNGLHRYMIWTSKAENLASMIDDLMLRAAVITAD